jgi:hypothetical protein
MCTRKRKSDTRPLQRRSCTQNSPSSDRREGGKEVEKRIEEKVVLLALHAYFLAVRPKRELKGVVCARVLLLSFTLVSSSFYIERCECFLLFFFLLFLRLLLFFVIYIDLSIFYLFFFLYVFLHLRHAHTLTYIHNIYQYVSNLKKMCE